MKAKIIISLLCAASLTGCASMGQDGITAAVNTYAKPEAKDKKLFKLMPASDKTPENDLQYSEFSDYVEKTLLSQGYVKAQPGTAPNVVIFLGYSISAPSEKQESYSIPVFGQTGVSSSQTYGTVVGNSFSGTTYNTPTYGITSFANGVNSYTTFTRQVVLDAYTSAKGDGENVYQVWKTVVTSTGSSGDLRYIFPYMIVAAKPYIAINTGKAVIVEQPLNPEALKQELAKK